MPGPEFQRRSPGSFYPHSLQSPKKDIRKYALRQA
jgi:hypothetical protein